MINLVFNNLSANAPLLAAKQCNKIIAASRAALPLFQPLFSATFACTFPQFN
jgi:hypothetical protein